MSSIGPSLDTHCVESVFVDGAMDLREIYDAHGSLVYSSSIRAAALVAAWLVGITKRRIIDHVRAQRRHIVHRADEDVNAAGSYTARFDRVADQMLVADALRAPPDRTREAIELAYLHDMTHDDIAHKTGVPLGTVKSDIRRACCEFATTWSPPMTDDATPRHRQ